MSFEARSRETLITAGFIVVERHGAASDAKCIVTATSTEARRRVRRQQCGLVFVDGLIAKVDLNVAVSVLATQLIAQFG